MSQLPEVSVPPQSVIHYIRDSHRNPFGVLVAVKADKGYSIGWSLCNKKDSFNKKKALLIAFGRALTGFNVQNFESNRKFAPIHEAMQDFVQRCNRYYKIN